MSHSLEPPLVPPLPPDLLFLDPSPQMRDVFPSPKFSSSPVADAAMKDAINLPQAKSSSATEVFSEINNSFKEPEILNPNIGENLKNGEASTSNTPLPSVSFGTVPKVLNSKENDKALVPAQILESNEIGNQAIQKKSAEDISFTTVSKAARQRDIIPREKSRVLVTSANPFAALDSDVVSNPDQSSSDDASEDQECLVVTNFIRSNDFYLASSSSSSGSKQQKNKKRKLSKRSPGSSGHPHSHGGTHQN
ncbi:hypothetical protein Bca101_032741 [Brassica carinata]